MIKLIKKLVDKTFLKFVLVGLINTAVGTTIMFGCYNLLGFSYWTSSALNYFLTSILSFFLNKYFTFSVKKTSLMQVARFAVNIMVCYFVAYGLAERLALWALSFLGEKLRTNIAMLIGMGLFVIMNYLGQRFFAFKADGNGEDK